MEKSVVFVNVNGDLLRKDILAMAGSIRAFADQNGIAPQYLSSVITGTKIPTVDYVDKVTKGLYKPNGYYYAGPPKEKSWNYNPAGGGSKKADIQEKDCGGGGTNTILVNIGKQTFERMREQEILLEDIKQGNEEIIASIKELTEIAARMLHIWGGERHGD